MEKGKFILLGVAAGVALVIWSSRRSRKRQFLGLFRSPSGPKNPNILFVGDSITATEINGRPTGTYPLIIKSRRPELKIDSLAKGGVTTAWMLQNLPIKLKSKKYGKVFIHGGINDAFTDYVKQETTIANIQKMIDMARANGAEVYFLLGYEPDGFMDWRKMPTTRYVRNRELYKPMVERWKRLQGRLQTSLRNATIVPKISLTASNTSDGTHPNGKGHEKFADALQRFL